MSLAAHDLLCLEPCSVVAYNAIKNEAVQTRGYGVLLEARAWLVIIIQRRTTRKLHNSLRKKQHRWSDHALMP